jgi:hypothetical protein
MHVFTILCRNLVLQSIANMSYASRQLYILYDHEQKYRAFILIITEKKLIPCICNHIRGLRNKFFGCVNW